jgi:hypothetical protein
MLSDSAIREMLHDLPRWALVAYAARCARRLNHFAEVWLDDAGNAAVNNAISLAERAASLARELPTAAEIKAVRAVAEHEWDEVSQRGDATDYAREFSAPAWVAAYTAEMVPEPSVANVNSILSEIRYVTEHHGTEVAAALSDLRRLHHFAHTQRWDADTPVVPQIFLNSPASTVIAIAVRRMSDKLAQLIAEDSNALEAVEWRDLERVFETVFSGLGYGVELTPGSKDGGFDLVIQSNESGASTRYLVEVKHWRSGKKVGSKDLTDFVHVVAREKSAGGLFLATYGFAVSEVEVITEVQRTPIFVGGKHDMTVLCQSYARARSGLWMPAKPLGDVLHRDYRPLALRSSSR